MKLTCLICLLTTVGSHANTVVIDDFTAGISKWHADKSTVEAAPKDGEKDSAALKWTVTQTPDSSWQILNYWFYPPGDWSKLTILHVRLKQGSANDKPTLTLTYFNDKKKQTVSSFTLTGGTIYQTIDFPLGDAPRDQVMIFSLGVDPSTISNTQTIYIDSVTADDGSAVPKPPLAPAPTTKAP